MNKQSRDDIIVIPRRKPKFQKEFIWRGQGYDCKWDFISNTKYNFNILPTVNSWALRIRLRPRKSYHMKKIKGKKIANDRKVIPDPIDDRKFQEWKESGKSGILLGITLNPRKCIGEKVRRIPINVETKW